MAKKFHVGQQILSVSDELEEYNELRHKFVLSAECAKQVFHENYEMMNSSIEDVKKNVHSQVRNSLRGTIMEEIRLMLDEGIYDVDEGIFWDEYCEPKGYLPAINECNSIIQQCNAIDRAVSEKKKEREYNKESRGRVVGGGFGFSSAVKGMAMAGGINAATGLAYSGANSVMNWIDERKADNQKKAIFKDPDTLARLEDSVFDSAFNTHYAYIDVVEERKGVIIPKYEPSEQRKALAMNNNIAMLTPERELEEKIAVRMLEAHPYVPYYYETLIDLYGDENGEIRTIAEFFHVDIEGVKKGLLTRYYKSFDFEELSGEEEMIDKLTVREGFYGYGEKESERFNEMVHREYCEWKLSKYYDNATGLYLKEKQKGAEYLSIIKEIRSKVKAQIENLFNKYFMGEEHRYLHVGQELSEYVYFSISNNTQIKSSALSLTTSAIIYGEGLKLDYEWIDTVNVANQTVVINDVIRIPLLQSVNESALQAFLSEAVKLMKGVDISKALSLLELTAYDSQKIEQHTGWIKDIFRKHKTGLVHIMDDIALFSNHNLYHIEMLNHLDIVSEVYGVKSNISNPVFWLEATDNKTIFCEKGLFFTWDATYISYDRIDGRFEQKKDSIVYTGSKGEIVVYDRDCIEPALLVDFLNNTLRYFSGKAFELSPEPEYVFEDCNYMEDFYKNINSWILKVSGEDSRLMLNSFFMLNYNNKYFYGFLRYYKNLYDIDTDDNIVAIVRRSYYSNTVMLIGTKNIYVLKEENGRHILTIPLESVVKAGINFSEQAKSLYIEKINGEKVLFSNLADNGQVSDRAVLVEELLNRTIRFIKGKEGLPNLYEKKSMTMSEELAEKYEKYFETEKKISKNIAFITESDALSKIRRWSKDARGKYLASGEYEKIVCFFRFPGFAKNDSGLVISEKYIYIRTNSVQKVALDEIIETRISNEDEAVQIQFATNKKVYAVDVKEQNYAWFIHDFMAEIIFMMQKDKKSILDIYDLREMEIQRKNDRRQKVNEFTDEYKEFITKIAAYCDEQAENGLFDEDGPQIYLNDESDEFRNVYQEALANIKDKPAPCEIPLLVLKPAENSGKGKLPFGKKKYVLITNEFAYNLKTKGITADSGPKSLKFLEEVMETEANKLTKSKITLRFADEYESVCEVPEGAEEQREAYLGFYRFLMQELSNVVEQEIYEEAELMQIQSEISDLCGNICQLNKAEIQEIQEKLLDYSWSVCKEQEIGLELRMKELVQEEILGKYKSDMTLAELDNLQKEILLLPEPMRYKKSVLFRIQEDIVKVSKENVKEKSGKISEFAENSNLLYDNFGPMEDNIRTYIAESILSIESEVISIKDVPLMVGLDGRKVMPQSYFVLVNSILIYDGKKFKRVTFSEIEKIRLVQKLGNIAIAAVVKGKDVTITTMHKKNTKEYAKWLWKSIRFLETGEISTITDEDIEMVSMKDQAKAVTDNVSKTVGAGLNKISSITEGLAGEIKADPKEAAKKLTGSIGGLFGKDKGDEKGSSLVNPEMKDCPNCGNKVKAAGKFCGKCGYRFN